MLDFLIDAAAGCFLIAFFVMLGYGIGYIPRFLLNWATQADSGENAERD